MELKNLHIAHRGLHNNEIPENSIKSFIEALNKNMAIELDIRLLKDKNIVVFHDENLKRMTGINKKIENCTYEDIKNIYLKETTEKIPLLKDVLELINNKVLLIIELKNKKVGLEKEVIKILDNYENFCIQSFNLKTLYYFKVIRPKYIIGLLVSSKRKTKTKYFIKTDFISHSLKGIDNKYIKRKKSKNIPIFVWTIRNNEELLLAQKYGDSFIAEI